MKDLLTMLLVSVFGVLLALSAAHASTIRLNSSSTDPIDSNVGIDSAVGIFHRLFDNGFSDNFLVNILSYKGC